MPRRNVAICLITVVSVATATAWLLWKGGVFDTSKPHPKRIVGQLVVIELPRPNSPAYTTEEATTLLPRVIARSRAIDPRITFVAGLNEASNGFRVHVTVDGKIETINFFGETKWGMDGLRSALELSESLQYSNPLSVLLTSETDGWQSVEKQQILELLFRPSIQLSIVAE